MKILIITTNGVTGFFKGWPERIQGRGLVERGHQVRAITYLGQRDFNRDGRENIDGIEVLRLRRKDWFSPGLARELLFGLRPDVVHLHHLSNQFAFEAAWLCKLRRIPVVMTPHGLFHDPYLVDDRDRPFDQPARYSELILTLGQLLGALRRKFKPKRHLKNYLQHSPLKLADRLVALSGHDREVLQRLGLAPGKLAVIGNAVDPDWWNDPQTGFSELPAEITTHSGPLVLFMGQLKYRKGFDLLARAIPAVLAQCPDTRFVFVGHSPIHETELLQLVEQAGAGDRFNLLNNISEGQKAALFQQAARQGCYVLPTRYEGFGIPLIEAMSLGCPVVSTAIPVIDEIIQPGQSGLLFELENVEELAAAIVRLLRDPELRVRVAAGGLETVRRFYTPVIIDQLEALYRSLGRK